MEATDGSGSGHSGIGSGSENSEVGGSESLSGSGGGAGSLIGIGLLPLGAQWVLIISVLTISSLISTVKIALLSVDKTGLEVIMKGGDPVAQKYASLIHSMWLRINLLLTTLLLGSVITNSLLAVFVWETLIDKPIAAFFLAAALIFFFDQMIPQVICSRKALAIGFYTIPIAYSLVVILFVVAWPVSKFLDFALGEEIGDLYSKAELKTLVSLHLQGHAGVSEVEGKIVSGILGFAEKEAKDIMTPFERVFMLEINDRLDKEALINVMDHGYSRIPIYSEDRQNVQGLLLLKDLVAMSNDANFTQKESVTVRELLPTKGKNTVKIFPDTKLRDLLKQLTSGTQLAFVHDVVNDGPGDPYYKIFGVVSLEDVIEEILQDEFVDKADVSLHLRTNTALDEYKEVVNTETLSEKQITDLANFISRTLPDVFGPEVLSNAVLVKLLAQTAVEELDEHILLYTKGKSSPNFTLLVEGKAKVVNDADELVTEREAVAFWGINALINGFFQPDFNLVVSTPEAKVIRISFRAYNSACKVSKLKKN